MWTRAGYPGGGGGGSEAGCVGEEGKGEGGPWKMRKMKAQQTKKSKRGESIKQNKRNKQKSFVFLLFFVFFLAFHIFSKNILYCCDFCDVSFLIFCQHFLFVSRKKNIVSRIFFASQKKSPIQITAAFCDFGEVNLMINL